VEVVTGCGLTSIEDTLESKATRNDGGRAKKWKRSRNRAALTFPVRDRYKSSCCVYNLPPFPELTSSAP